MDPFVVYVSRLSFVFIILSCQFLAALALLCVMFPFGFVTFPYGVSNQVWYLIVSIPCLCLLFYL